MQRKPIAVFFVIIAVIFGVSMMARSESTNAELIGGCKQSISVGKSVNGKDIEACQLNGSTNTSGNALLIVGSVHGDEPAGKFVVEELTNQGAPNGSEIWVIRDANPDGAELATRRNANQVDINRNFPTNWLASVVGTKTYSGPAPASEPETKALMNAVDMIKPTRVITFHQPYAQIDCSPDRPDTLSKRLSDLTGYRAECIPGEKSGSPTKTYTGTFTIWVNGKYPETTALTFELGLNIGEGKLQTIVRALQTVASEAAANR